MPKLSMFQEKNHLKIKTSPANIPINEIMLQNYREKDI